MPTRGEQDSFASLLPSVFSPAAQFIPGSRTDLPMSSASSFNDSAGRELLAMIRNARRNKFGDPKYHSGRKKKEYASPYLEFLDKLEKTARRTPTALAGASRRVRWVEAPFGNGEDEIIGSHGR